MNTPTQEDLKRAEEDKIQVLCIRAFKGEPVIEGGKYKRNNDGTIRGSFNTERDATIFIQNENQWKSGYNAALADQRQELAKAVVFPNKAAMVKELNLVGEGEHRSEFGDGEAYGALRAYDWLKSKTQTLNVESLQKYIEALEAECEASVIAMHWAESAIITPSQAGASINSKKDYNQARAARLKLKEGK